MRFYGSRALRGAFFCLFLTSFVTACVKNNNKDGQPGGEEIRMEQKSLSVENATTQSLDLLNVQGYKKVIQEWTFSVSKKSNVSVSFLRFQPDLSTCSGENQRSSVLRFEIQKNQKDADGKLTSQSEPLLTQGNIKSIEPGNYLLRAIIDNEGRCGKFKISFRFQTEDRPAQVVDANIKAQWTCQGIENDRGGIPISSHYAQIKTMPMNVRHHSTNHAHNTQYISVMDMQNGVFCSRLATNLTRCNQRTFVEENYEAMMTTEYSCHRGQSERQVRSNLRVFAQEDQISAQFNCRYKGNHPRFKYTGCTLDYNLGERLPVKRDNQGLKMDLEINRRHVQVNYERDGINVDKLPGTVYVNFYNANNQAAIFDNSIPVTKARILNGNFSLESADGETGIRRKMRETNMRDLILIISSEPNDDSKGIFHRSLRRICDTDKVRFIRPDGSIRYGCPQ